MMYLFFRYDGIRFTFSNLESYNLHTDDTSKCFKEDAVKTKREAFQASLFLNI